MRVVEVCPWLGETRLRFEDLACSIVVKVVESLPSREMLDFVPWWEMVLGR
jgi:hypothetical protein